MYCLVDQWIVDYREFEQSWIISWLSYIVLIIVEWISGLSLITRLYETLWIVVDYRGLSWIIMDLPIIVDPRGDYRGFLWIIADYAGLS